MTLDLIDFFCGAGGSSQGAAAVPGVTVRLAANHWDRAIESHAANFPRAEHFKGDIHDADVARMPPASVFWASPECPNFSQARGRRHHADPAGSRQSMPGYLRGYAARIAPAAERLVRVSLECRPALEVIATYGQHPGTLIYADPPYPASTRPNSAATYRHEMNGDAAHAELAAALRACRGPVVISGYPCPLYDDLYAGWHRHEIRAYSGYGTSDKTRTEVLWSSRPLAAPGELPLFGEEASA